MDSAILHITYTLGKQAHSLALPLAPQNSSHHSSLATVVSIQQQPLGSLMALTITALQPITLQAVALHIPYRFEATDRLFCNGFQSWTLSDEWLPNHRLKPVKWFAKPLANAFGDYDLFTYPQKKGHLHGWTYGYIKRQPLERQPTVTLVGSCMEHSAYTGILFEANPLQGVIKVFKDCQGLQLNAHAAFEAFNLFFGTGNEQEVFDHYAELVKTARKAAYAPTAFPDTQKIPPQGASGFTTWYNYYTRINHRLIQEHLQAFAQHKAPINFFQIDDGWQQAVGDWTKVNPAKFPDGLAPVATSIKQHGFQPGLWLAPFICQKQSDIFKQHPQWLLRHKNGKPVTAGYNIVWRSYMYALNFYHPQVQDYLRQVFDTLLNRWGFELLKPDFLYAVALLPPSHKTRGQVMFEAMQWLRQTVGNKLILGCGVPLGAAFGTADFCRIGADVHLSWDMPLLNWLGSREGVSTISALKNAIHRRQLNGRIFFNDPDVSILRPDNHHLNPQQQFTLFLVNQIFGSLQFISDNINQYTPQTLWLYCSQFPLRQKNIHRVVQINNVYRFYFTIGNLHYLAFCNLSGNKTTIDTASEAAVLPLPYQTCLYHSHTQTHLNPHAHTLTLMPYQSVCLMAVNTHEPVSLAGGNAHLFPCADIDNPPTHLHNETLQVQSSAINQPAFVWFFCRQPAIALHGWALTKTIPWEQGYLHRFDSV